MLDTLHIFNFVNTTSIKLKKLILKNLRKKKDSICDVPRTALGSKTLVRRDDGEVVEGLSSVARLPGVSSGFVTCDLCKLGQDPDSLWMPRWSNPMVQTGDIKPQDLRASPLAWTALQGGRGPTPFLVRE